MIMEEPLVKSWLNQHIHGKLEKVRDFVFNQGTIFLTFLGLLFILLIVGALTIFKVKPELLQKIKDQVMWTPVLRS